MSWFILVFFAVSFFTTLNILQRVLAVDSKNPRAMSVVFNMYAGLIAISIFLITKSHRNFSLPTDYKAYLGLLTACFFYAMFERGRFHAAKLLDASTLTTITNLSVLIAFVGSFILYSEEVTLNKIFGSILILCALFLVSYNTHTKNTSKKGIIIALIISTMLGLGCMLDKLGTMYFNPDTYNILIWLIPIIFIYLPYVSLQDIKYEFKTSSWKVFIIALLNVLGYLFQLKALQITEATKVIPMIQTSTLFTILIGVLLLKEKENIGKKIIAGILAIVGTILLV